VIEVFYRYRVHPAQVRAFEHAYGSEGPWAELFRKDPQYVKTRLFRHDSEPHVYVTIDVWHSKDAYDAFRSRHADEYNRLDAQLSMLKLEEHLLGYYEGSDQYSAPADPI
jgi:heme-degrading monooxygenase HmoA